MPTFTRFERQSRASSCDRRGFQFIQDLTPRLTIHARGEGTWGKTGPFVQFSRDLLVLSGTAGKVHNQTGESCADEVSERKALKQCRCWNKTEHATIVCHSLHLPLAQKPSFEKETNPRSFSSLPTVSPVPGYSHRGPRYPSLQATAVYRFNA